MQQDFPEFRTQGQTVIDEDSAAYQFLTQSEAESYKRQQDLIEAKERNRRRLFKEEATPTFEADLNAEEFTQMLKYGTTEPIKEVVPMPEHMGQKAAGPFGLAMDLFSTEAEIASYGLRNSNNWFKIASVFGLFDEKPEATEALKSLLPWEERDMSVRETIAKIADIHEKERTLVEQVFTGIASPTGMIGGVPAASGTVSAGIKSGFKATDPMQVLQSVIDNTLSIFLQILISKTLTRQRLKKL